MADWVRFKLDRQIDHILVDEAQDTNKAQWDIIRALSDDFFSGMGVRPTATGQSSRSAISSRRFTVFKALHPNATVKRVRPLLQRIEEAGSN